MPTYPTYKLGDVAEIINGKNQKEVVSPQGKYPIYGSGGIIGWATGYLCKENSTIIGRKGTIDSPIFVNRKFWNVDTAFGIQPSEKVLPRYLFFFCKSFDFKKLDKSTTIPSLAKRDLLQIPIPLPPLATQHAIVTRIETLFAELDKAVQHLRTAQQQIKTYRQAVLNHWLNNDEGKWEMVKLKDCTKKIFAGGDVPKNNFSEIKTEKYRIPIYANAVKQKGLYGYTDVSRVNEPCVTIAGRGSGTGHTEIREEPFFPIVRLIVIIPSDNLNNSFLKYMVDSKTMAITGSAIPQLTVPTVEEYEFSLPPLAEQQRIVKEIESRLSQATASETYIENALQQAEALRQSILKKAFSGELV
jgi:Restriction endonuclease S subunits